MKSSRRGFLKLLGLSTVGATVAGPALFSQGSARADLLVGQPDHLVFEEGNGPLLEWDARAHYLWASEGGRQVPQHLMMRNPRLLSAKGRLLNKRPPGGTWSPQGEHLTYQVDCPVREGEDPHVAFFMAAARLQQKIHADTQELGRLVSGRSLVLVTYVVVPIMAFPHREKGFYLETQLEQFAAHASDIANRGKALSSRGEVPLETPHDIEFTYLMKVQEELRALGLLYPLRNPPAALRGELAKSFNQLRRQEMLS